MVAFSGAVCAGLAADSLLLSEGGGDENKLEDKGLERVLSPEETEGPAMELLAVVPECAVLGWVLCPEPSSTLESLADFLRNGAMAHKQTIQLFRTYPDMLCQH